MNKFTITFLIIISNLILNCAKEHSNQDELSELATMSLISSSLAQVDESKSEEVQKITLDLYQSFLYEGTIEQLEIKASEAVQFQTSSSFSKPYLVVQTGAVVITCSGEIDIAWSCDKTSNVFIIDTSVLAPNFAIISTSTNSRYFNISITAYEPNQISSPSYIAKEITYSLGEMFLLDGSTSLDMEAYETIKFETYSSINTLTIIIQKEGYETYSGSGDSTVNTCSGSISTGINCVGNKQQGGNYSSFFSSDSSTFFPNFTLTIPEAGSYHFSIQGTSMNYNESPSYSIEYLN